MSLEMAEVRVVKFCVVVETCRLYQGYSLRPTKRS